MIINTDRSKWIGASDTHMLFANPDTSSFRLWWAEKLGLRINDYTNIYMLTGNALEHKIIDLIDHNIIKGVKPIYKRRLRLRVNYDGHRCSQVVEIKTTGKQTMKLPINHMIQVQSLMFGTGWKEPALLYSYLLDQENYKNYYLELHRKNITMFEIPYATEWVQEQYLPRLRYVAECLKRRRYPERLSEINGEKSKMSGLPKCRGISLL